MAKAVRTPAFKQRVVPDKRWKTHLEDVEKASGDTPAKDEPRED